jgi:hypothetical protein
MATLADVRSQYPQYNDLSDTELADALHSKFYSNIPKDVFYTQIGLAKPVQEVGMLERMFGPGSPVARTIKGAVVDPALAVNQMLASTGLFGSTIKQGATQLVQDVERATQEGRARVGSTGFDPYQLLGGVISPVNRMIGITRGTAVPPVGVVEAGKQAAATGAVMGGLQPVTAPTEQFAEKKLEQIGVGAILGPVIQGGVSAVGTLSNRLSGLTASGRQQFMQDELNRLAGPERDAVIRALQDAGELVKGSRPTAAEAIADIPTAAQLMAAQRKISTQPEAAGSFLQRTVDQQAARVRELQNIAGTEAERLAIAAERDMATGPLREQAFAIADVAKNALSSIDRQVVNQAGNLIRQTKDLAQLTFPALRDEQVMLNLGVRENVEAIQRASAETTKSLKALQLQSLEQQGVFPVLASDITNQIDKAIRGTSSDLSKQVLSFAKDKILSKADENGILSSRDLYDNVRKTLNQDIQAFLQQGERFAQGGLPQQAASASNNVKNLIDVSLNKSTDGVWGKYLRDYQKYSNKLNRMEIGNFLSQKLQTPLEKETAGTFAAAVENATQTIKASTGIPRFEKLSDVLTSGEVASVNNVLADLKRASKAEQFSRKVASLETGLPDIAKEVPPLLDRTLTLGRAAMQYLQRGNAAEYNKTMAELMLNPQSLATFMTSAIPQRRIPDVVSSMVKFMDPPTRTAFLQMFAIQPAAKEAGTETPPME